MNRSDGRIERKTLFDDALAVDLQPAELDLDRLRRGFSELFDRAALAVHRAGYDLDDTVVERFVVCCGAAGHVAIIRADALTDAKQLATDILAGIDHGRAAGKRLGDVRITALRIAVTYERWASSDMTSVLETSPSSPSPQMSAVAIEPYPPRYWWLKRILIAGGAWLVFLIALRLWWGWEANRRFEAEVARIRATGEPLLPEDFDTKPVPDDRNAVVLVFQAQNALSISAQDSWSDRSDWFFQWDKVRNERSEIERVLSANAKALDLLHQAVQRPDVDWNVRIRSPVINFLTPSLSASRALCKLCILAASYQHVSGDDGLAIQYLHDAFRHARIVNQQPALVTHLTAIASQALVCSAIEAIGGTLKLDSEDSGEQRNEQAATRTAIMAFITDLTDEGPVVEALIRSMHSERMWQFDILAPLKRGKSSLAAMIGGPVPSPWAVGVLNIPMHPLLIYDGVNCLKNMSDYADAARQDSWPTAKERFPALPEESPWYQMMHPFSAVTMPSLERTFFLHHRNLAGRRMGALVLALRLYELDTGGRPRSLAELVPNYISELPNDPLDPDGRPIRYLPNASKPIVYSVGEDGIDNGGEFTFYATGGVDWKQLDLPFFVDGKRPTSASELNNPAAPSSLGEDNHDDKTDAER